MIGAMPTSGRAIKSVLWNFLGIFTSRYTDFGGYWLFGFLIDDLSTLHIDLLTPAIPEPASPEDAARHAAVIKFGDQLGKSRLARHRVREASLTITKFPERVATSINGQTRPGHRVTFIATAILDNDRRYERELTALVAPHDPLVELRSTSAL